MTDKFNDQKDILISIKHEISLLHQQVDYLLRNEKTLELLDLDVMMNRTHTIYDKMCSIDLGSYDEMDCFVADAPRNDEKEEEEEEPENPIVIASEAKQPIEEEFEEEEEPIEEEETVVEENEDAYFEEEVEEEPEKEEMDCFVADAPRKDETSDDLGFILNFEPAEAKEEDNSFELESQETLADKLQQEEDHSLAAKLQHSSVKDLHTAIGINDKFLFVNELFGGSMEKYSKSISNLNDLKTLEGALVYMNELRIDLQWNSNNEAYKKLLELVHRKFD